MTGETAEATSLSKRSINRAIARVEAIPADVRDLIRGTYLDKGTYLDSLKGMEPDDQQAQINGKTLPVSGSLQTEAQAIRRQARSGRC